MLSNLISLNLSLIFSVEFLLEEMAPIVILMEQKSFKSQFRFKHFDNVSSGFQLGSYLVVANQH